MQCLIQCVHFKWMWHGEDVKCFGWAYQEWSKRERNKQMTAAIKHEIRRLAVNAWAPGEREGKNIQNVKHSVYTFLRYSNIQIKARARCSSNPLEPRRNGMTQSPTKYVTQIRKQAGEMEKYVFFISSCQMSTKPARSKQRPAAEGSY